MTQLTITKAYTRNDIDPILQINVGDLATLEEDGWWKITDPEGNKKARIHEKLVKELTVVEEPYCIDSGELRFDNVVHDKDNGIVEVDWQILSDIGMFNLSAIPIDSDIISKISLTYPITQEDGKVINRTFRFEENKLTLPRYNELEYEPDSKMFMLNGIFLPESPKYLHQLQNCIFGLTFIDVKVEI